MRRKPTLRRSLTLRLTRFAMAALAITLLASPAWAASQARVALAFDVTNGEQPDGSLIFDNAGNLYGTSSLGGEFGFGNVFKLTPLADGAWTETVLHNFDRNGVDGANPEGSLIFDSAGNLYGTTSNGGADQNGAVFELSPAADGSWTETILFSLDGANGSHPFGSLTFDAQGNLYGTAWQGGHVSGGGDCEYGGCGVIFKLTPVGDGTWSSADIHVFTGEDGSGPFANVVFDAAGSLYTTTSGLQSNYHGTVVKLTPAANGTWTETVLHKFTGGNYQIYSGVILDAAGNIYGTTYTGGAHSVGTVFELTPAENNTWTITLLHSFNRKDGAFVYAGVSFDAAGNLWGTTAGYGSDLGSVYKLIPGSNGNWTIDVLHTFDDLQINGGAAVDAAGNIYTTTLTGGIQTGCNIDQSGCGLVVEVTQ